MQIPTQQINSLIDKLADKLAVPVTHLFAVLTRQARVEAFATFAFVAVYLVALAVAFRGARKFAAWASADERDYADEGLQITGLILFIALGIVAVIFGVSLGNMLFSSIGYLLNPEYYALQQLIALVK